MGRLLLVYVVPLILTIYCLVEAITSRDDEIRHLPKVGWILLVLLFPIVGPLAWLLAGRPRRPRPPRSGLEREVPDFPEYDRPGRMAASDPAADEEFLRRVRERAEEQRRRAAEQQRKDRERSDGADRTEDEPI